MKSSEQSEMGRIRVVMEGRFQRFLGKTAQVFVFRRPGLLLNITGWLEGCGNYTTCAAKEKPSTSIAVESRALQSSPQAVVIVLPPH